jgi:putative ABC transport system ATP-binding protein
MIETSNNTFSENANNDAILQALKVYQIYQTGKTEVVALKGLDIEMFKGELLTIVGPSGSGKSSLLNVLGGILRPSAGIVLYNGIDITKLLEEELVAFRRKQIGFIFQEGNLLPFQTALENVENTLRFLGFSRSERKRRSKELLKEVGLGHRLNHTPAKLSGGERQRVAIARALSGSPAIILADEPTGNLDQEMSTQVLELFRELNKETGIAFLIVTHDKLVASYATRSLELRDGMIIGQHGTGIDLSNLDTSRLTRIDEEGRLPVPQGLLHDIYTQLQAPVVLWKSGIQYLKPNPEDPESHLVPSLVFNPIVAESLKSQVKQMDNKICSVCNTVLPPNSLFCTSCGAKFI